MGKGAEGHNLTTGVGAPSPRADRLKGGICLSSFQESEFYCFTEAASALHCVDPRVKQPSDKQPVDFSFISAETALSPSSYVQHEVSGSQSMLEKRFK